MEQALTLVVLALPATVPLNRLRMRCTVTASSNRDDRGATCEHSRDRSGEIPDRPRASAYGFPRDGAVCKMGWSTPLAGDDIVTVRTAGCNNSSADSSPKREGIWFSPIARGNRCR
jgi:hypothetical protein